jgi:hypothetical protein
MKFLIASILVVLLCGQVLADDKCGCDQSERAGRAACGNPSQTNIRCHEGVTTEHYRCLNACYPLGAPARSVR